MTTILGIKLEDRIDCAVELQRMLTDYGCSIGTRLGLHGCNENVCKNYGIILLEIHDDKKAKELAKELDSKLDVRVQMMIF